jgi:hypothetical protein
MRARVSRRMGEGLRSTLCGNFKPVGQAQAGRSWLLPLYGTAVSNGAGSRCGEKSQDRLQLNLRANRPESFDALMQL